MVSSYLAAAVDAGNAREAALAIVAHPASLMMSRPTVRRLADIGMHGATASQRDVDHIMTIAEIILDAEETVQ